MENPSFEKCARNYLGFWLEWDEPCHSVITNSDASKNEKLCALGRAIWFYRIFYGFHKKFEEGKSRYEPVLCILESTSGLEDNASAAEIADKTHAFIDKLHGVYTNKRNISAASKLLWLKFRHPFIIYDEMARAALGAKYHDLCDYYGKWLEQYEQHRGEIESVCASLASKAEVARERWFHERVFDNWIWTKGIAIKTK